MTAIEVAAGAAILSFVASIVGVFITVRGNRSNVNLQYKHALRVAALDRRLAVHQEAYTLWWELPAVAHGQDDTGRMSYVRECENWWAKNCLYLTPKARRAFRGAYRAASEHKVYKDDRNLDLMRQNWQRIMAAGDAIVEGVGLPSWDEDECRPVYKETTDGLT